MSYDDRRFMAAGFRVRHKYRRRGRGLGVCVRCGVKRRYRSSGWQWLLAGRGHSWMSTNPPCMHKETSRG